MEFTTNSTFHEKSELGVFSFLLKKLWPGCIDGKLNRKIMFYQASSLNEVELPLYKRVKTDVARVRSLREMRNVFFVFVFFFNEAYIRANIGL